MSLSLQINKLTHPILENNKKIAVNFLSDAQQKLALKWDDPHLTVDFDGDICCEWWCGKRKITVYISETDFQLLKINENDNVDHFDQIKLDQFIDYYLWMKND